MSSGARSLPSLPWTFLKLLMRNMSDSLRLERITTSWHVVDRCFQRLASDQQACGKISVLTTQMLILRPGTSALGEVADDCFIYRDTTDIETLQLWLDEFLDADCTNEVFEVGPNPSHASAKGHQAALTCSTLQVFNRVHC